MRGGIWEGVGWTDFEETPPWSDVALLLKEPIALVELLRGVEPRGDS